MNGYVYKDPSRAFNLVLDEEKLQEANRRHDAAVHVVSMDRNARYKHVNPDRYVEVNWRSGRQA